MFSLGEIVGQAHAIESLLRVLASGRIPQALLFHGPEGVGKAATARGFASALLCEAPQPQACGRCAACRLIERAAHPDLLTIQREPKRSGRSRAVEISDDDALEDTAASERELSSVVTVDQIRELNRLAGHAPRLGRRRIFIVDPADRMNVEAQNALLKTLEEPPGPTVVILVAARPHLLLTTVRSRCFTLGFSTVDGTSLRALLERRGVAAEEAGLRAALAEGRPGSALTLDLEELAARREELMAALEALAGARPGLSRLGTMGSSLAGSDEATLIGGLELLEGLLRDAARLAARSDPAVLVHRDLERRLARVADQLGSPRLAELIAGIERSRGYLRSNVNRTLIAEAVLASIAGALAP